MRSEVGRLPRIREALVSELVGAVLTDQAVQLAAAAMRASHPDARHALALRLCDAVDRVVANEKDSLPSDAIALDSAGVGARRGTPRPHLTG